MTAGLVLVAIALQPPDETGIHDLNPVIPVCLQSTNVVVFDVMLPGMFALFGIAILLGVRTGLLSAFILAVTLMVGSTCIQSPTSFLQNHFMLFILIMSLGTF